VTPLLVANPRRRTKRKREDYHRFDNEDGQYDEETRKRKRGDDHPFDDEDSEYDDLESLVSCADSACSSGSGSTGSSPLQNPYGERSRRAQTKLEHLERHKATLEDKLAALNRKFAAARREAAASIAAAKEDAVAGVAAAKREAAARVADKDDELASMQCQQSRDKNRINRLERSLATSKSQLALLRDSFEEVQSRLGAAVSRLEYERAGLGTTLLFVESRLVQERRRSAYRLEQLGTVNSALQAAQTDLDGTRAELQREKDNVKAAQTDVDNTRAELERERDNVKAAHEHAATLQEALMAAQTDLDRTRAERQRERRNSTAARQCVDTLTRKFAAAETSLQTERERVAALNAKLSDTESKLKDETERGDALGDEVRAEQELTAGLRTTLVVVASKLKEERKRTADLEARLKTAEDRFTTAVNNVKTLGDRLKAAEDSLAIERAGSKRKDTRLTKLNTDLNKAIDERAKAISDKQDVQRRLQAQEDEWRKKCDVVKEQLRISDEEAAKFIRQRNAAVADADSAVRQREAAEATITTLNMAIDVLAKHKAKLVAENDQLTQRVQELESAPPPMGPLMDSLPDEGEDTSMEDDGYEMGDQGTTAVNEDDAENPAHDVDDDRTEIADDDGSELADGDGAEIADEDAPAVGEGDDDTENPDDAACNVDHDSAENPDEHCGVDEDGTAIAIEDRAETADDRGHEVDQRSSDFWDRPAGDILSGLLSPATRMPTRQSRRSFAGFSAVVRSSCSKMDQYGHTFVNSVKGEPYFE